MTARTKPKIHALFVQNQISDPLLVNRWARITAILLEIERRLENRSEKAA